MRYERKKRPDNPERTLAIIGGGLLVIVFVGFYLYSSIFMSKSVGRTKSIFLTVHNNSEIDTLAPITVIVNGHEIFSKIVTDETFESVDVNLILGRNKFELFAHGRLVRQDTIKIDWPLMYNLDVYYFDTDGQQHFNYSIEEFFYE